MKDGHRRPSGDASVREPRSGDAEARWRVIASIALVGLGGLVAAFAAGAIGRSRRGLDPLLVQGALLLASVLTMVVLFVLGRNLVKLYLERARSAPGSRYRTKVIALVAGLVLLPSLLLFMMASGILQGAVGQWLDRKSVV